MPEINLDVLHPRLKEDLIETGRKARHILMELSQILHAASDEQKEMVSKIAASLIVADGSYVGPVLNAIEMYCKRGRVARARRRVADWEKEVAKSQAELDEARKRLDMEQQICSEPT